MSHKHYNGANMEGQIKGVQAHFPSEPSFYVDERSCNVYFKNSLFFTQSQECIPYSQLDHKGSIY